LSDQANMHPGYFVSASNFLSQMVTFLYQQSIFHPFFFIPLLNLLVVA